MSEASPIRRPLEIWFSVAANALWVLVRTRSADWAEMLPALRLDHRIGPAAYLRPGLGVAGGNLERDLTTLQALCRVGNVDATYLDALADHFKYD